MSEGDKPGGLGQSIASKMPVPQHSDNFYSIPWCKTLLTAPNTVVHVPPGRDPAIKNYTHDRFFNQTLAHADGVPACICFHPTPRPSNVGNSIDQSSASASASAVAVPEQSMLFSLPSGMDGYPGVLQGGVVGVLMDEILGLLVQKNMEIAEARAKEGKGPETPSGRNVFLLHPATVSMNVRFRKPTFTPAVVLGRGRIEGVDGRSIRLFGELVDAKGAVTATCESVWVAMDRKMKL